MLLGLLVVFGLYCLWFLWNRNRHWAKQGIPTPPGAHWLFGHLLRLENENEISQTLYTMGKEVNSKTYGIDLAGKKFLVTSDVDLLKEVHIKHFESMHGRMSDIYRIDTSTIAGLASSHGPEWHRVRSIMEPAFTTEESKTYEYQVMCVVDEFMQQIHEVPENTEYDYKEMFVKAVTQNAFQFSVGLLHPWEYTAAVKGLSDYGFEMFERRPLVETPLRLWMCVLNGFCNIGEYLLPYLNDYLIPSKTPAIKEVMEVYEKEKEKIKQEEHAEYSVLAYMVDKEGTVAKEEGEFSMRAKFEKKLTPVEMFMNIITMLVAASTTTHVVATLAIQQLAKNPRAQKRLYDELKEKFPKKELITFDELANCDYLQWVLNETQRMNTTGVWAHIRVVTEPCVVGNGIRLSPGDGVMTDIRTMQRDEKYFGENVWEFNPDRWDPKYSYNATRPAVAFIPFGFGPRMCPGKNLAAFTFKFLLARLVLEYEILETPKTTTKINGVAGAWVESAYVKMVRRKTAE